MSEQELHERSQRLTENRLKASKIGRGKPLSEFDLAWPKAIDRAVIEELLMELQNIFLEIYSNFSRNDEEE